MTPSRSHPRPRSLSNAARHDQHGILETLIGCGVNRVSLGVQSFVDKERSSVGRLHTRKITPPTSPGCERAALATSGSRSHRRLPHQTQESWNDSLTEILATGGGLTSASTCWKLMKIPPRQRELLAGGSRYHAHYVPDDDLTLDLYPLHASDSVKAARNSMRFNFARPVTYSVSDCVTRGTTSQILTSTTLSRFGVDAHSMLRAGPELVSRGVDAVRLATPIRWKATSAAEMRSNPAIPERCS